MKKTLRDQVIEAYKEILKTAKVHDPAALDDTQPEVKAAEKLYDEYYKHREKEMKSAKTKREYYEISFELDTLYLDAGFDDPEFLGDTINDFLMQATPTPEDAPGEDITDIIKKFVALRKKFGGWIDEDEEAFDDTRKKKTVISKNAGGKPGKFPIWKKIKLGTCTSTQELEKKLAENNYNASQYGKPLIAQITIAPKPTMIDLIKIEARELGFKMRVDRTKLFAAAEKVGLALVPAEVGPQLAIQYGDHQKGETVFIAMEPIMDKHDDPNIFYVSRDPAGKYFGSNYDIPEDAKRGSTEWIFTLKK